MAARQREKYEALPLNRQKAARYKGSGIVFLYAFMPRCLLAFFYALTKNLRKANNIGRG